MRRLMLENLEGGGDMAEWSLVATKTIDAPVTSVLIDLKKNCKEIYVIIDEIKASNPSQLLVHLYNDVNKNAYFTGVNGELDGSRKASIIIHLTSICDGMWVQERKNGFYGNCCAPMSGVSYSIGKQDNANKIELSAQYSNITISSGTIKVYGR